ncbi:hypothetical protein [Algoriphagus sp. A40]|uniref:hypothetical protein n=1 Tax=Algoriphagus sp. A40 TaxID=1945863 RepID=UPI000984A46E|nr:hypothetical protein [Algoriphagus sp. A40]OOG70506.1 hypothetical protein B0E43_18045 [Algoriphagus sp. A40]
MKKLFLVAIIVFTALSANGQAQKYLNFGGVGTGLYAGLEFPVGSNITVGPNVYTDWDFNRWVIAAKGNYYLDDAFGLGSQWDVYVGANVGYRLEEIDGDGGDGDGFNWGAQVGGRWFWNESWGINAEFGGGSGVIGGVGLTKRL